MVAADGDGAPAQRLTSKQSLPQAQILAAGRGKRVGERADIIPKCLLQVGGKTLLEHQLNLLNRAGIYDICIVAGYHRNKIVHAVQDRATVIENPVWAETNSLYSFTLAKSWVTRDLVVINGDVLCGPRLLRRVLSEKQSCIAYDSGSGQDAEHMKIVLQNGRLRSMGKTLCNGQVHGENVGILKFTAHDAIELFQHAEDSLGNGARKKWLAVAVEKLARERAVSAIDVCDLPWIEIDFEDDLFAARDQVWPAIRISENKPER